MASGFYLILLLENYSNLKTVWSKNLNKPGFAYLNINFVRNKFKLLVGGS